MKLNVLLDLPADVPAFASLHEGERHEVASLDEIPMYPDSYYVMDYGYVDLLRLHRSHGAGPSPSSGSRQTPATTSSSRYPLQMTTGCVATRPFDSTPPKTGVVVHRRCAASAYIDRETDLCLIFLTNQLALDVLTVSLIYKHRWKIELFFNWIKQHLRLSTFFSTDPNGVRVQI